VQDRARGSDETWKYGYLNLFRDVLERGRCHNGVFEQRFLELSRVESGNHLQRADDFGVLVHVSQKCNIKRRLGKNSVGSSSPKVAVQYVNTLTYSDPSYTPAESYEEPCHPSLNTNDPVTLSMESNSNYLTNLRRGLRAIIYPKEPGVFWSFVPNKPRPDNKFLSTSDEEKINHLFTSWDGQNSGDISFEDASEDMRNRWIVEEWIFAIALLEERRVTVSIIVDEIHRIRGAGDDWNKWVQKTRRWIERPPH